MRSALGASRARLLRQLLTESLTLSVLGGALGLAVAAVGTHFIVKILPQNLPRATGIHLDWLVLCFTALISLASGILFGFAPALKMFKRNVQSTLRPGGRGISSANNRMQDSLVVFQMALALVLLIGAGLMIRSIVKLSNVDPGFRSGGVLTFGLEAPPEMSKAGPDAIRACLREAQHKVAMSPNMDDVISETLSSRRFAMAMLAVFTCTALLPASIARSTSGYGWRWARTAEMCFSVC